MRIDKGMANRIEMAVADGPCVVGKRLSGFIFDF